jgi:hypothetical protein
MFDCSDEAVLMGLHHLNKNRKYMTQTILMQGSSRQERRIVKSGSGVSATVAHRARQGIVLAPL